MAETSGVLDKWIICRICLQSTASEMTYIFEEGNELYQQINICSGLELTQHQELPDKMCSTCQLLLKASIKFRTLCHRSQEHLSRLLDLTTVKNSNADGLSHNTVVKEEDRYISDAANNADSPTFELDSVDSVYDTSVVDVDYTVTEDVEETLDEYVESADDEDPQDYNVEYLPEHLTEQSNSQALINTEEETEDECNKQTQPSTKKAKVEQESCSDREANNKSHVENELFTKTIKNEIGLDSSVGAAYVCNICGNIYAERVKLTAHMKIHNGDKPHECEICHKRFRQTPQLARHMNSHTGNRPYKCSYCDASFADPSTCIKHQRIHTNERPYKCDVCNKAFAYSNVLKVHLKTHTGEKPYTCRYCERSFTQLHHKKAHERSHAVDTSNLMYSDEE